MPVAARAQRPRAPAFLDPPVYARHRPEATLLYQLIEQHYPAFREVRGHLLAEANLTRATGATGSVTLVQRFGSALNLNVHFHMIFPDGAYLTVGADPPVFRHVDGPGAKALQVLVERIATRIGRLLEKRGLVERDIENAWLSADASGSGPLDDLLGHSITYRIAVGPRAGQKLFTLQTVPARLHDWKEITTVQHAPADSRCTLASTSSPAGARSSNDCAAM